MQYIIDHGMRIVPESSWRPVLQRSVDAYYEGRRSEGIAACIALLQEPGLPEDIRELTYRNQTFYAQPLADLVPGATWQPLSNVAKAGLRDPSPVDAGDRLVVLLCATPGARAARANPDPLRLTLDEIGEIELAILCDEFPDTSQTLEARPFLASGRTQIAIIARDVEPAHGEVNRAGLINWPDDEARSHHLFGPRPGNFAQGWSPVVTPDGMRFIAWWEPTEVFRLDDETGEFEQTALRMAPHIAERFRGGSPGVSVPGGYLFLVNETVDLDEGRTATYSRFVRLDNEFHITDISPQFFVAERGADAACGLTLSGGKLVAGFTSREDNPLLVAVDVDAALSTVVPVDSPGFPRQTTRLNRSTMSH